MGVGLPIRDPGIGLGRSGGVQCGAREIPSETAVQPTNASVGIVRSRYNVGQIGHLGQGLNNFRKVNFNV